MEENDNAEGLFSQLKELFALIVDEGKLRFVESASLLVAELLAFLLVAALLLVALFLLLLGGVWLLSLYVGFPLAALLVAVKLLLLCAFLYAMRRRLFVNCVVARLCTVFFAQDGEDKKL